MTNVSHRFKRKSYATLGQWFNNSFIKKNNRLGKKSW